jgi:hypothetical protein
MHVQARFYVAPIAQREPRRPPRQEAAPHVAGTIARLIGAPEVGSEEFRHWNDWLGHRLAEDGPAPIEPHLAQLAALALDRGAEPVFARILADRTKPEIVRSRAFFKVAVALDEPEPAAA